MYTGEMPADEYTSLRRKPNPGPAVVHFGERLQQSKYGPRLTRKMYAIPNKKSSTSLPRAVMGEEYWASQAWAYEDEDHKILSDEFCELQRAAALENFDLNMAFFAQIPVEEFEEALTELMRKHKQLRPVTDLRTFDEDKGLYVMVLDGYKQAYVGQASDIRGRIKRHWAGVKQFDRLLWGHKHESVLSIDSFRALDTTRISAARTSRADSLETRIVDNFPPDYLLNRIGGGSVTGLRAIFIAAEIKRRQLVVDPVGEPSGAGDSVASYPEFPEPQ